MSQARRGWLLVLFIALAFTVGRGSASARTMSTELLGFKITLLETYYNAAADETTFTYRVESTRAATRGLSHFVIAFCLDEDAIVASSHYPIEVGKDPTTGLIGIQFDDFEMEPEDEPSRVVWFVLKGDWTVADVEISGKAATKTERAVIAGPSCEAPACRIEYSVERSRIDLRVLRPGTYASRFARIFVSGNGGAKLTFSDFDHLQYLPNGSAPTIEVAYSFGSTLEHADAYGWWSADEFNGTELEFFPPELEGGIEVTLWVRYIVRTSNYSSDYEAGGRVSVVPICT